MITKRNLPKKTEGNHASVQHSSAENTNFRFSHPGISASCAHTTKGAAWQCTWGQSQGGAQPRLSRCLYQGICDGAEDPAGPTCLRFVVRAPAHARWINSALQSIPHTLGQTADCTLENRHQSRGVVLCTLGYWPASQNTHALGGPFAGKLDLDRQTLDMRMFKWHNQKQAGSSDGRKRHNTTSDEVRMWSRCNCCKGFHEAAGERGTQRWRV